MDASVRSVIVMGIVFVLAQLGALVMVASVLRPQDAAFENPNDPLIPIYYIIAMVLFTFLVLYIIKMHGENIVKIVFLGAVAFTIFYVVLVTMYLIDTGLIAFAVAIAVTAVIAYLLVKKPEWYVIDAAGAIVAIGVIGIFGISLDILPVMILLIVLAVYDAISVYGTKHMVALADGVTQMRLPILLVIPKKKDYSYLTQKPLQQQLDEGSEREAMFMGLGDIIIPGVLIASASKVVGSLPVTMGTLIGSVIGFAVLMRFVLKGNPQAGLPLLNGGAIIGYAVSYLLVFGNLTFGITLPW